VMQGAGGICQRKNSQSASAHYQIVHNYTDLTIRSSFGIRLSIVQNRLRLVAVSVAAQYVVAHPWSSIHNNKISFICFKNGILLILSTFLLQKKILR
jgi:hypothetical protein